MLHILFVYSLFKPFGITDVFLAGQGVYQFLQPFNLLVAQIQVVFVELLCPAGIGVDLNAYQGQAWVVLHEGQRVFDVLKLEVDFQIPAVQIILLEQLRKTVDGFDLRGMRHRKVVSNSNPFDSAHGIHRQH